jgi:tRNA pseudouridine38-40 synthase
MRNIKLTLAYDGTDFHGWERQAGGRLHYHERGPETEAAADRLDVKPLPVTGLRTVQGVFEAALARLHKREVAVTCAGRTDAGVHAAGQVVNFLTDIDSMEPRRFIPALNSLLPRDIRVLEAVEVPASFHARFSAMSRRYQYRFIAGRRALPWEGRYALQLWRCPRVRRLNDFARLLHGEMDCSLFAAAGDPSKSRFRYIEEAVFFAQGSELVFEIKANAFLWKMVRSVAGSLLYYDEKDVTPADFARILARGNRTDAGPTLPSQGLTLVEVAYPPA